MVSSVDLVDNNSRAGSMRRAPNAPQDSVKPLRTAPIARDDAPRMLGYGRNPKMETRIDRLHKHRKHENADSLALALQHHRAGALDQANAVYRRLVRATPSDADAWHLWGVLAAELRHFDSAISRIERALQLKPLEPVYLGNLGNVFLQQRRLGRAIDCFRTVLLCSPADSGARKRLGMVCEQQLDAGLAHHKEDRLAEAEGCYRDVLNGQPERADAWHLLGLIAMARGDFGAAHASIDRAISLAPDAANFHNSLGALYQRQQRYAEAIVCFEHAIQSQPESPGWHRNLALALRGQRRYADAVSAYCQSLALRPDDADAYNELGTVFMDAGRRDESETAYKRALALRPDHVEAHYNLGILLRRQNRWPEALACFERALGLNGDFPYVAGLVADSRSRMCQWMGHAETRRALIRAIDDGTACLSPFLFLNWCDDAERQRHCAELRSESIRATIGPSKRLVPGRDGNGRIRIAYMSPDFGEHPVAHLLADLVERHNRSQFEVIGVSLVRRADGPWRRRLSQGFDRFLDVHASPDHDVVEQLRRLNLNIAVDLAGYTAASRPAILAARVAPVQVNYLGFPGPMAAFADYILADRIVIPVHQHACYAEHVVYLPETFQCAARREMDERCPPRAELGLPSAGFVFCCFNNSYKIQPEMFDVWMRLLARIEGSVLWLRRANDFVEGNLRREARARGVDPSRLVFARHVPFPQHMARHSHADLFLDTLPYNAHTTASDALWTGLPVLTCMGNAFAGRVGASLLHAVGLPELVTDNLPEYEAQALRLAREPHLMARVKAKLRANVLRSPLFDIERFRRHIEAAYRQMSDIAQRGEAPRSFEVPRMESSLRPTDLPRVHPQASAPDIIA